MLDGTVSPVSRYRERFTEILWQDFTTAILLVHTYIIEGKLGILKTKQKSEEITHFYHIFFLYIWRFSLLLCGKLMTILYNLNLTFQHI